MQSRKKAGRRAFKTNILDGLADAVILIDDNRLFVDGNKTAFNLLGHRSKGLKLEKVIDNEDVIAAVDRVLDGHKIEQGEIYLPAPVSRNCEMRIIELAASNPEKAQWVMLVLHDVTNARKTEQMRADFISNISHELRSPISSLIGFIETLQGPARDDTGARERFLGIMEQEAKRMSRLVDKLLTLSKVETDEHIRPDENVHISRLLAEISTVLSARAEDHNMQIDLDLADNLPVVIGDKDQLLQVFRNLIDNAISYGDPDTTIRITAENQGRVFETPEAMLAISVSNKGPGISAEDRARLTERFYRVDKGRSQATGGTGLGLAIVKHIINRHRGRLDISSDEGGRTTFSVVLPVRN